MKDEVVLNTWLSWLSKDKEPVAKLKISKARASCCFAEQNDKETERQSKGESNGRVYPAHIDCVEPSASHYQRLLPPH